VEIAGKNVVVTGAGAGIGAELCRRFAAERAAGVVVADLDGDAATAVADTIGGIAVQLDVADEDAVAGLVTTATERLGSIDLLCLNAGIAAGRGIDTPDATWQRIWEVNVMSHVYGVRAVLPQMLERGRGYLLHTASAAGLLSNIGAAPYTVTKHAVVALAEWLSITYGSSGITVSCLSPQFVDTELLDALGTVSDDFDAFARSTAISVTEVADAVVAGVAAEAFHILPHPEVARYVATRANDHERWLARMRDLQHQLGADPLP
jgi:NAD(P)-dependent dehydrogenase (short-subunit alcohol dehydrogenase family)